MHVLAPWVLVKAQVEEGHCVLSAVSCKWQNLECWVWCSVQGECGAEDCGQHAAQTGEG